MIEGFHTVAVVAVSRNGVIGRDNAMPWHLPSDLKRFRARTEGRAMIMGRRTLESIGRALPGRDTIVLSRSGKSAIQGVLTARDLDEACRMAAEATRSREGNEIVIAGGGEIYRLFLPVTDEISQTVIDARIDGDTRFPELEPAGFIRVQRGVFEQGERDSAPHRLDVWRRP